MPEVALPRQISHPLLALPQHDEHARQQFASSLMRAVQGPLKPGVVASYDRAVRQHGRAPLSVQEMRHWLVEEPYVQMWSGLKLLVRELQHEATGPMVERQLPALIDKARARRDSNRKKGSLALDAAVTAPRYNSAVEIHRKPGGYHSDLVADDVFAGAEYDHTVYFNSLAAYGPRGDAMGHWLSGWLRTTHPAFAPARILEVGCTVGHSVLPWVDAYPQAEVHAIDVAAPCLRYAHARAEALGKKVHFAQANAEATRFADASFDLVVSHILLHELSAAALRNIFAEGRRLLRPGGLMAHMEGPPFQDLPMVDRFFTDWDTHYNAEPFLSTQRSLDLPAVARAVGFAPAKVFDSYVGDRDQVVGAGAYASARYIVGAWR